jgi:hypothetical protein
MDAGAPISYEVLEPGTPVYSSDGREIGLVAHVLSVPEEDVFDGIVIEPHSSGDRHRAGGHHTSGHHAGGDGHRFADANDVDTIHERAVILKLDAVACEKLPRPSENPAVLRDDPADPGSGSLGSKLRRAWDLISGNY